MRLAVLAALLALPAHATEATEEAKWGKINATAGLQMWTPVLVAEPGTIVKPQLIGPVVKVHYAFTEMLGAHVRGTMGFNSVETPGTEELKSSGWAAAAGLDVYAALGRKAMWYNTVGFSLGGGKIEQKGLPGRLLSTATPFQVG